MATKKPLTKKAQTRRGPAKPKVQPDLTPPVDQAQRKLEAAAFLTHAEEFAGRMSEGRVEYCEIVFSEKRRDKSLPGVQNTVHLKLTHSPAHWRFPRAIPRFHNNDVVMYESRYWHVDGDPTCDSEGKQTTLYLRACRGDDVITAAPVANVALLEGPGLE